ncbi:hypothetical protein Phum_PHUM475470 [Pediculus humanus corporis]|uniref:Uncharacterized protein n=1 Tax=Pediculus humanus subsp. corporis TaxID=121224 RepID=E0VW78_PEDHC|nr:uncharacterized protein Phum_PHUM475470 [Pediculus humanus corporis]EEB17634.1 hypothetical protein Phum_PHUM475470 [Pediculus humanus corporis]
MPSGIGGSYRSLGEDVYRSTTVSKEKFSVVESVKKAFNLIGNNRTNQGSFIVTEEDGGNDKKSVALLRKLFGGLTLKIFCIVKNMVTGVAYTN